MRDIKTIVAIVMAVIVFLFELACSVFGVWAIISMIDIAVHNLTTNYVYSEWNLFEIFFHINI